MATEGCIGEIRMFGGNFAPRNWALCDGQLLPINQNSALFSILGTTYGGDGRTTFGLPDLRGRLPMHPGNGPGLTNRTLGQKGGVENVTLNNNQLPNHTHSAATDAMMNTVSVEGDASAPGDKILSKSGAGDPDYGDPQNTDSQLDASAIDADTTIGHTGGNQAHTNIQPFTCVNFIICLAGIFPSRS